MSELISKGILSEPIFEKIETGENFEAIISLDEKKYLKRWGELPGSLVDKVAKSSERNGLLVKQYIENKGRYGKTIIFALNGYHAYILCEEFKKQHMNCDFVFSNHGNEMNTEIIQKFMEGNLDVLININILTEDSDVPHIQTVF